MLGAWGPRPIWWWTTVFAGYTFLGENQFKYMYLLYYCCFLHLASVIYVEISISVFIVYIVYCICISVIKSSIWCALSESSFLITSFRQNIDFSDIILQMIQFALHLISVQCMFFETLVCLVQGTLIFASIHPHCITIHVQNTFGVWS